MKDQMVQAARSGRQNIAEGCHASGTSKKTELKLVGVARASLEEPLLDFEDYLRQNQLPLFGKEHPTVQKIRGLAYVEDKSYCKEAQTAANVALCLIHQANYLLDHQLKALEQAFMTDGGFTERLYKKRKEARGDDF